MNVYIVVDTKGRPCYIASSEAKARASKMCEDIPGHAILRWEVDVMEFFAEVLHPVYLPKRKAKQITGAAIKRGARS